MYNFLVIAEQLEKIANNEIRWQDKVSQAGEALVRFNRPDLSMVMLAKIGYLATLGEAFDEQYNEQISQWLRLTAVDFRQMDERVRTMFDFTNQRAAAAGDLVA